MTKRSSDAAGLKSERRFFAEICAMGLRKGKWTDEEEKYAAAIIGHFESNLLPLSEQRESTIRLYLGKQLHCDPMRISKKFAGNNSVGKHFFCKKQEDGIKQTAEALEEARDLRDRLRTHFVLSVEKELEESSKRPKRIRIRNRKKTKPVEENELLQWDDFSDDDLGSLQLILDDKTKDEDGGLPVENVCVTTPTCGSPEHEYRQHPQTPPTAPISEVFQHDKFVLDCAPVTWSLPVMQPAMNLNVPYGYTLVCTPPPQSWACAPAAQVFDAQLDAILGCGDEADSYDFDSF